MIARYLTRVGNIGMLPTVFLSLSGVDAEFVQDVHNNLPDGHAYFYPKSFSNGENLISAMEERINKSSTFVFFASKASVESVWVNFEIDRARLSQIQNASFRCLVFPIDPDIDFRSLPSWMKEAWIATAGQSAKDIARHIRGVLAELAEQSGTVLPPLGRGALIDSVRREYQATIYATKIAPSLFVFAGHAGIGRRTLEQLLLRAIFPANPHITFGPVFDLPPQADLSDIYRAIREEIEPRFSIRDFETSLAAFVALPVSDQVGEIWTSMLHFAGLGQAVTIVIGYGLYEDRGELKPWALSFMEAAARYPQLKVALISGRQLRFSDLRLLSNVQQIRVEQLDESDIKTLILETVPIFGGEPQLPEKQVLDAIGGHPTVARLVARLLALRGPAAVAGNLRNVFDIQEEVLADSLSFENLDLVERDFLSILSWVPKLNGNMLSSIICQHHGISQEDFANTVEYLIAGCLMQISGPNYLISAPIRSMFRRKHGYGSTELRSVFADHLRNAWNESVSNDAMKSELFDAFVYMTALEGGSLPEEFHGLLLASTLQDLVRDAYDRRHADEDALGRVVSWGTPALEMKMDDNTREEILSYVLRAHVRLQHKSAAASVLAFIKKRDYRSAAYLEAFMIRLGGGDLNQAVALLRTARRIGKYMNSVVADLAICLKSLGRWSDLATLLSEEERRVEKSPVLLDIKIGMLVAAGEFGKAEREIARLRSMPFDDGRADSRAATIMMNRDRRFGQAFELLTDVLNRQTRGGLGVRRLRALAAARASRYDDARRDSEYLRSRPGGEDAYTRIEAEIKLVQRDYTGAAEAQKKVRFETVQDRLLKARILEASGLDPKTPLDRREALLNEAATIRMANKSVDEYDND